MPYQLSIDTGQHCAFFRHWGQTDLPEVADSYNRLKDHPDYLKGMNIMRDLREVDAATLQEMTAVDGDQAAVQALEQIAAFDLDHGACKLAVISGPGEKREIAEALCAVIPPSLVARRVFTDF